LNPLPFISNLKNKIGLFASASKSRKVEKVQKNFPEKKLKKFFFSHFEKMFHSFSLEKYLFKQYDFHSNRN